jgi:hypothetical protein
MLGFSIMISHGNFVEARLWFLSPMHRPLPEFVDLSGLETFHLSSVSRSRLAVC